MEINMKQQQAVLQKNTAKAGNICSLNFKPNEEGNIGELESRIVQDPHREQVANHNNSVNLKDIEVTKDAILFINYFDFKTPEPVD